MNGIRTKGLRSFAQHKPPLPPNQIIPVFFNSLTKHYMKKRLLILLCAGIGLSAWQAGHAQLSLATAGVPAATIDFDNTVANVNTGTFDASGASPAPVAGDLNSNAWLFLGAGAFQNVTSAGAVTTGGIYAFETSPADIALGIQPTGSNFTGGNYFALEVDNNTGVTLTSLTVSYVLSDYNDQPQANSVTFEYSTTSLFSGFTSGGISGSAITVTSDAAADPVPAWAEQTLTYTISGLSLTNGSTIYLRWAGNTVTGSGEGDQLAFDDITVTGSVATTPAVAFDTTSSTVLEIAGTHQVPITMDLQPTADVTVQVADLLSGSATPGGNDYTYVSPQDLTFPAVGQSYPYTQFISITIVDDGIGDDGETIDLGLNVTAGPANNGSNTSHTVTISELEPGLIINEFSNGPNGNKEYIELLVVGVPGTTIDIGGWILDDNNGDFTGGPRSGTGIAPGYIAFEENCNWDQVPVGSIIVLYAGGDPNADVVALGDDPNDENEDYLYVIGIDGAGINCSSPIPTDDYFEGNDTAPDNGDDTYPATTGEACWTYMGFRNDGDAVQLRRPDATFFQGISYWNGTTGAATPATNFSQANHPLSAQYPGDAVFFSGNGANTVYSFDNAVSNDFNSLQNWTDGSAGTDQTPGAGNNTANTGFINNFRRLFPINTINAEDTCVLGDNEFRRFLDDNDDIFLTVKNNQAVDHGRIISKVTKNIGGTVNVNLTDKPYFQRDLYQVVVDNNAGAGNYDITIYLSDAELTTLTTDFNAALIASGYIGAPVSETDVLNALSIYKGSSDPANASSDADVSISTTTSTAYLPLTSAGYKIQGSFNDGFSSFRLAVTNLNNEFFPVEWLSFTGEEMGEQVRLNWETGEEINNEKFEVLRSPDRQTFEVIGEVPAGGSSKHSYRFVDRQPLSGVNFYRLKQVDFDGTFSYSSTIEVNVGLGAALELVGAYPNPTNGLFSFELLLPKAGEVDVRMLNPTGQEVWTTTEVRPAGQVKIETDVSRLSSGLYFYELRYQGQVIRGRFLKH